MKKIFLFVNILIPLALLAQQWKLPVVAPPLFKKDTASIVKFGAIADGYTLNTKSINAAIDAQSKKGGGVVMVPAGIWLTGPVVLKNNVNLYLATGATLLFTTDFNQYPLIAANWEGLSQMRNQSPISATDASNIGITGKGIIDGNGDAWRMVNKDKVNETQWKKLLNSGGVLSLDGKTWFPSESSLKGSKLKDPGAISPEKNAAFYESVKDFLRPNLLLLTNCKKILLEGVTFQNSAAWGLHTFMCEDLTVRNITVKNPWYAQDGDGIDVESCKNVLIENSVVDVGDEGISMKSGRDVEGRKRARSTENVIVRGCTVYTAEGGFVIGSEMSGGVRNIYVSNCTFVGTDIGLGFRSTRGRGGVVENIFIRDIYMKGIEGEAIRFDMNIDSKESVQIHGEKRELPKTEFKLVGETTPSFKNFHISNLYCAGAEKAIYVRGLPEMHVKDLVMENMLLQAHHGIDIQESTGLTFKNIKLITVESEPMVEITQSDRLLFDNITHHEGAYQLFRVNGDRSNNIRVINTDATKVRQKVTFELGANSKMLNGL